MKKALPVHPYPDREYNFSGWVHKIRSKDGLPRELPKKPEIKSVYIRRSENNPNKNHKNWIDIQENSKGKYLEKTNLMEEIRQRKIENRIIDLLYSSRYPNPVTSESK